MSEHGLGIVEDVDGSKKVECDGGNVIERRREPSRTPETGGTILSASVFPAYNDRVLRNYSSERRP